MNAAADYAAARAALTKPLPAYVGYSAHTDAQFGPFKRNETRHIVVRTKDGTIVRGEVSSIHISSGESLNGNLLSNPVFEPDCYEATGARSAEFEGKSLEAIALRYTCHQSDDHEKKFKTLYVDPTTHDPVAAVEADYDPHVAADLVQRFTRAGDHVLPSTLDVRVKGSGFMSWLDLTVRETLSDYTFSDRLPPVAQSSP